MASVESLSSKYFESMAQPKMSTHDKAEQFSALWDSAQRMSHSQASNPRQGGISGALLMVDNAIKKYESEAAAIASSRPRNIEDAYLMAMKNENNASAARTMMTASTAIAGSAKSCLTQLLKNQ